MENINQKLTFSDVLRQKILQWFAKTKINKILLFLSVSYFLAFPDNAETFFLKLFTGNNFFLIKVSTAGFFIKYWQSILKYLKKLKKIFFKLKNKNIQGQKTIEGVPIYEIAQHLFEEQSFKREVVQKFQMPQNKFEALAKKLEELEVLTRGENNARVLNQDLSRAQVLELLNTSNGKAEHLTKPIKIFQNGKSSNAKTAKEIESHVKEINTPLFSSKRIRLNLT